MRKSIERKGLVIGIDLGDRYSHLCVLDREGTIVEESRIPTSRAGFVGRFGGKTPARIVLEAGTHSPWISRLLQGLGQEVLVANPRKLRLICESRQKADRADAATLARLGRFEPKLLHPLRHRSQAAHEDLAVVRSRSALVRSRVLLINHVRGVAKSFGTRLKKTSTECFHKKVAAELPESIRQALEPVMVVLERLTEQIHHLDRSIQTLGRDKYPKTQLLRQVQGVGPVLSLAFVLTLEDPERFRHSRRVGRYLGLTPARHQSGSSDPQKRISKEGDGDLRHLLVQGAQSILKTRAPDSDLKRFGLRLAQRGGRGAKKRAIIAVARKLAVLLHRLWRTGEVYEPLYHAHRLEAAAA